MTKKANPTNIAAPRRLRALSREEAARRFKAKTSKQKIAASPEQKIAASPEQKIAASPPKPTKKWKKYKPRPLVPAPEPPKPTEKSPIKKRPIRRKIVGKGKSRWV